MVGPGVGGKLLGVGKREVEKERRGAGQTPGAHLEGHPSLLPFPGDTKWTLGMDGATPLGLWWGEG